MGRTLCTQGKTTGADQSAVQVLAQNTWNSSSPCLHQQSKSNWCYWATVLQLLEQLFSEGEGL